MIFPCKHPAAFLGVASDATTEGHDEDFEIVVYHLLCRRCGEDVEIRYAKVIGGVDAFMERK